MEDGHVGMSKINTNRMRRAIEREQERVDQRATERAAADVEAWIETLPEDHQVKVVRRAMAQIAAGFAGLKVDA